MHALKLAAALAVMGIMSLAGGFLGAALLLDTSSAQADEGTQKVLRAAGLEIVDSRGVVRARVGVEEGNSVMALYDAKGTRRYRAVFEKVHDRISIFLSDKTGDDRYLASLTEKGEGLLSFLGDKDEKLMTLLAGGKQASSLILKDPDSKRMVTFFAGQGQATMQLSDSQNRLGWLAAVLKDGRSVTALAKDGKLRIRAMTKEDSSPELVFLDGARNKTWTAGK